MGLNTDLDSRLKLEFQNKIWVDRNLEHKKLDIFANLTVDVAQNAFYENWVYQQNFSKLNWVCALPYICIISIQILQYNGK